MVLTHADSCCQHALLGRYQALSVGMAAPAQAARGASQSAGHAAGVRERPVRKRALRSRRLAAAAALGLAAWWPRARVACLKCDKPGSFLPLFGPPLFGPPPFGPPFFCARCEPGFYCNGSGAEVQCPKNTFADARPPLLQPASGGDGPRAPFENASSAADCRPCEPGTFAPAGSRTCSFCDRGFSCAPGASPQPCPPGTYTALGTVRSGLAASCAADCAAGFFCPGDGTRQSCPHGTYSAPGAATAAACSAAACGDGHVCAGDGRGYRLPCPAGSWAPAGAWNAANCTAAACGAGFFCPGDGTRARCPGDATSTPGAASATECYKPA